MCVTSPQTEIPSQPIRVPLLGHCLSVGLIIREFRAAMIHIPNLITWAPKHLNTQAKQFPFDFVDPENEINNILLQWILHVGF